MTQSRLLSFFLVGSLAMAANLNAVSGEPFHAGQLIEPLNKLHNHGSCVQALPNGDVLACWYKGTGERTADDVRIVGARLRKGKENWSPVFELADFPGFPDCNACLSLDAEGKLWMFWPLIVANRWETAILMARYSTDYLDPGPPKWAWQTPIILKPGEEFEKDSVAALEDIEKSLSPEQQQRYGEMIQQMKKAAGDKYAQRMGWMPRARPTVLPSGRFLLPLYSDGFNFSIVAISDDHGATWTASRPILSMAGVQPSIVQKKDGTLVAYMRDNGPPPKRIIVSESGDNGSSWTRGADSELLDSGAGVQALVLQSGKWLVIHNDVERGRHSLAVHASEDDGATWKWVRHLEKTDPEEGSFGYPSLHQDETGMIHGSYSYRKSADGEGGTIKYVRFNEEWVLAGDPGEG